MSPWRSIGAHITETTPSASSASCTGCGMPWPYSAWVAISKSAS
jgi:hypothetical protein